MDTAVEGEGGTNRNLEWIASGKLLEHRELNPVPCDNLEAWVGGGGGREVREGEDICVLMADFTPYGRNQHNTVEQLSSE